MYIRTMTGTILAVLVAAAGVSSAADNDEPATEQSAEAATEQAAGMTPEMEAMRHRLVEASEAACNHAFSCAMEGVPESVRGMIDRSQICRMYDQYETISADEYDPQCAEAALAYFACIENTSCEAFTDARGAQFCGAEGEEARKQCDDE